MEVNTAFEQIQQKQEKQNNDTKILREQFWNLSKKPRFFAFIHNQSQTENLFNFNTYFRLMKNGKGLIVKTPQEMCQGGE